MKCTNTTKTRLNEHLKNLTAVLWWIIFSRHHFQTNTVILTHIIIKNKESNRSNTSINFIFINQHRKYYIHNTNTQRTFDNSFLIQTFYSYSKNVNMADSHVAVPNITDVIYSQLFAKQKHSLLLIFLINIRILIHFFENYHDNDISLNGSSFEVRFW